MNNNLPTSFIVNTKTGAIHDRAKCLISLSGTGDVRVYPQKDEKNVTMDGVDCVMVNVHRDLRHSINHPTFVDLIKRLAHSEGIPLNLAILQAAITQTTKGQHA